jgi:serine/threonine protein kinase
VPTEPPAAVPAEQPASVVPTEPPPPEPHPEPAADPLEADFIPLDEPVDSPAASSPTEELPDVDEVREEGSAPNYNTLRPVASDTPAPAPAARRDVVHMDCCRVCLGSVADGGEPLVEDLFPAELAPICATCQEEIRLQEQTIDDYVLVKRLGGGGMGVVALALRKADGTPVAIKTITPAVTAEPRELQRFLREASILRDLQHPNIVAFREMGTVFDRPYIVMDFIRGIDASRLVKTVGPLPVGRAVGLVCQLLTALEYAHAKDYVHRDIKPANLLVTQEEGREVVKVADFGLARIYQSSKLSGVTLKGDVGGTIAYMAPEQITNFREAKPPADRYAAGATLYNLLTRRLIYDLPHRFELQMLKVLHEDPVPIQERRADIPDDLAELVHCALARNPKDRFEDVTEMRKALLPFADE